MPCRKEMPVCWRGLMYWSYWWGKAISDCHVEAYCSSGLYGLNRLIYRRGCLISAWSEALSTVFVFIQITILLFVQITLSSSVTVVNLVTDLDESWVGLWTASFSGFVFFVYVAFFSQFLFQTRTRHFLICQAPCPREPHISQRGDSLKLTTGRRGLQASTGRKSWYSKHSLHLTKLPWTPNKFYQFLFYLSWYCEAESTRCRPCGRWSSLTPHQRWSFQMTTCKISFTSFHLPSYFLSSLWVAYHRQWFWSAV